DGGGDFHEGLAHIFRTIEPGKPPYVAPTNLFGFIDTSGNLVLPLQYGNAGDFHDGISWVGLDGDTCYINKEGEIIARFNLPHPPTDFNNGLLRVYNKGKPVVLNTKGETVIPPEGNYNMVGMFSEGFAAVQKSGGTFDYGNGYIDISGKLIVPLEYQGTEAFHDNLACVFQKDDTSKGGLKYFILEKVNAVNPTESRVFVDNREITFDDYNINDNNYFKLRDIAYALNGSSKQFSVNWNEWENSVLLKSGEAYVPVGGELEGKSYKANIPFAEDSKITLNGQKLLLPVYNIDGNNYFKLRDIGRVLNFSVEWNAEDDSIIIDSTKGYSVN
ncbi:MAG: WG repeat-containing protein, partial [Bacillota bacterium]|nr:WG repeat-containing protein [Bacillota bacterium]